MTGRGRILVINPNSNEEVTVGCSEAVAPLRLANGPKIDCVTLAEGPFGIETQAQAEAVVLPLIRLVQSRDDADAFVIACYSDPGLAACREATARPVFGIQESAVLAAMARGERIGVIALSPVSIRRHLRYLRQMGVMDRVAAERPLHLSVAAAERTDAFAKVRRVAEELRDLDGADVLVLGCAGMARHRASLEDALGLAVIDPVQAAAANALTATLLTRGGA